MSRILHMCLSVRGALNWDKRRLSKLIRHTDTGKWASAAEAKDWLMDHLAQGHEVVPMCNCPGFDFKDGCPGKKAKP